MKKIYSLLLLAVMAVGVSFQASADVTVKVNAEGVGHLRYQSYGASGKQTINSTEFVLPADCGGEAVGTIYCEAGYTMTITDAGTATVSVTEYEGEQCININPSTAPDGTTIVLNVTEGGGGGGGDVEVKPVTFIFSPAGSGYVVTTHFDEGVTYEDETYRPAEGEEEVEVPYDAAGSYLIKPNPGYALLNAKDETQVSNPHYTGITPNLNDGFIHGSMGSIDAGAQIVVTATKNGSFTVKGVGENIANIVMTNNSNYNTIEVTDAEQTVNFDGGTTYSIRSSSATQLWKVEVTDKDDFTQLLEGNYGSFEYTPNDGDKVVIYSDKPEQHAQITLSYQGEGVNSSVISTIKYAYNDLEESTWKSGSWTMLADGFMEIYINETGFVNFSCTVNGTRQSLSSNYNGKYYAFTLDNGAETVKEYKIVISAEKEKIYNVTFNCEHPEAVQIVNGSPLAFSSTGQSFQVGQSNNMINISPKSGWILDGILIDGELPETGTFNYGNYYVTGDCTITINVTNKAEKRTKTVVVYVDESVANPTYLDLTFNGESQTIKPGYNTYKFCDEDVPFTLGYYAGGSAEFYLNGEVVSVPSQVVPQDGDVIKYFNGTPVQQVVTYAISDDVTDLIEIVHDHITSVDHKSTTQHSLFKGTEIHIKLKSGSEPAEARRRAQSKTTLTVKADDQVIDPDENGVYTIKVGDTAPTISVTKEVTTGVDDVVADGTETFDVYNLQGIVVKANATAADVNTLPAGLYIANGKKVLVK